MQHYKKITFANTHNILQNSFNSEVTLTWKSSGSLKVKPTINYFLFFNKDLSENSNLL